MGSLARLGGKDRPAAVGEWISEAGHLLGDLAGPLLSRRGSGLREEMLSRALLLAFLVALALLLLELRKSLHSAALALPPLAVAALLTIAGGVAWREWRGRAAGRAYLLLGALGGLAALTLARAWLGGEPPGRGWRLAAFLAPAALIDATRIALHGGTSCRPTALDRGPLLYAGPILLYVLLPFLGPEASLPLRDGLVAGILAALALLGGVALSLACLRRGKPIDVRQRGKLIAAAEAAALAAVIATGVLRARGADAAAAVTLLGVAAAPAALAVTALRENLLWIDRFLRRALAFALAVPLAALLAWGAVRTGDAAAVLLVACLLLAAPAVAARLGRLFERFFHRSGRRRGRALATLADRLAETRTLEDVAGAARAACGDAFPGVSLCVLAVDSVTGGLREIAPAAAGAAPRTLAPEHPLSVHLRGATAPLTRYDVLSAPRFAQARGAWLRDLDEIHAAALLPCRDGEDLKGVLLLGGQIRGGFFTEDEMTDAAALGAALAPALSRALVLESAERRIALLESHLEAARAQTGRAEADGSQAMEDLEESTRHVMTAYAELKVREGEAREVRGRVAASAKVLLAGRVAERMAGPVEGALAEAERHQGGRGRAGAPAVQRARLGLAAIAAITRRDQSAPCDLAETLDAALAALDAGWRRRIEVERKITDVPRVAWPSEALHAALLALLLNAEEAIAGRGTIAIAARGVEGRVVTVGDAEAEQGEAIAPSGQTTGKIAWMSGAPRIEIVISDDGCGIHPEHQERLFHPFFTTKPRGSGALGLGLAIVADALAHHGGSIRIESEPDQWTRVVLELPGAPSRGRRNTSRRAS